MGMNKATGNMYNFATATHTHLGGRCSHKCIYCYSRYGRASQCIKYQGATRLIEKELDINYGTGKVIFIEHMADLFAPDVRDEWIDKILDHCKKYELNKYIIQTKNPRRALEFIKTGKFPQCFLFGTTIETDNDCYNLSVAPNTLERYKAIIEIKNYLSWQKEQPDFRQYSNYELFVTIEPIVRFTPELAKWIIDINPSFVNIGADSKDRKLVEPSSGPIHILIEQIESSGIRVIKKDNLYRIYKNHEIK